MENNIPQQNTEPQLKVIDIRQLFEKLLSNWKLILKVTVVGGVVGAILSFGIPRKYTVVSKIAPELSLRTSNLASIASFTGLNSLLSNNNDALLPTVYPSIISSKPFLADLSKMPVNDSTLYYYIEHDYKKSWFGTIVSLPGMAIGGIKSLFKDDSLQTSSEIDPFHPTKQQDAILKMIDKSIMVDVEKKTYLVTVTVTMQDPVIAAELSRLIIQNLKKTVIKYRTQKTADNVEYLEKVSKDAYVEYLDSQNRYAYFLDHNQGISARSGMVEQLMLQNDVNLKFQLYSSLETELQQNRSKLTQETPVFAEIYSPSVPVRASNSRKSVALAFAFLACICSCVYVFVKK